ncbi:phospho-sugar mutase [Clostridiales bacterium COT073_COT-073]|nr:phospho-sugar mutase [Clostridiales bacterium COT073_COT-073]
MNYQEKYLEWLNSPYIDEETRAELKAIENDPAEIQNRFYKNLEFGTAGLRGILGAGTNRMNKYNVAQVTQGIADFICEKGEDYKKRGVAIAYDCRHFSDSFSKMAALIFAANGIKAYLFESLRPTPELSYTIRQLNTASGVILTASHNPKNYNGYKVYWEDGAQVLQDIADAMTVKIENTPLFTGAKIMDEAEALEKGLLVILGKEMDDKYISMVKGLSVRDAEIDKSISIVYTPLNGAGSESVQRVMRERGFTNFRVVPEQKDPDPNFTTIDYPNPEDRRAFEYAEKLGHEVGATLLIATDPDCDRLAIEVLNEKGEYVAFNGNQTGAILISYLLEAMSEKGLLPENPAIVKSIVTGDMGADIGKTYGVTTFNALTGFKNICGRIPELTERGFNYIFGYEESIGYTTGQAVRDKDGVSSSMLLCEAAAYYQAKGLNLLEVLENLFEKFGYYRENQTSLVLEGKEGQERIGRMMEEYRKNYPVVLGSFKVEKMIDYLHGYEDIPASNVLEFRLNDGCWYSLRPSGTEPKIKLYIYAKAGDAQTAEKNVEIIKENVLKELNAIE